MIESQTIEKIDFTKALPDKEYIDCTFVNCNFEQLLLKNIVFDECRFKFCNLSLIKTTKMTWHNVHFIECKMVGADFTGSNPFSTFRFDNSNLQYASFAQMKLKATPFINCNLQEVDFSEADLTSAIFDQCEMSRAVFSHTNLEKADLTSAYHFLIDPRTNRLKNARFSYDGIEGLVIPLGISIK